MEASVTTSRIGDKDKEKISSATQQMLEGLPLLDIDEVIISVLSLEEIRKMQVVEIDRVVSTTEVTANGELDESRTVSDPRMGVVENNARCSVCTGDNISCPGHPGYIELAEEYVHPSFAHQLIKVLTCVCNSCGGLLLTRDDIDELGLLRLPSKFRLDAMAAICQKLDADKALCRRTPPEPAEGQGELQACLPNPYYLDAKLKDTYQIMYTPSKPKGPISAVEGMVKSVAKIKEILHAISTEDARH